MMQCVLKGKLDVAFLKRLLKLDIKYEIRNKHAAENKVHIVTDSD